MVQSTVIIADESPGLREFAALICDRLKLAWQCCENAEQLLGALEGEQNFLLHVDLPGGPGMKVAATIWEQNPLARVLFWADTIAETCVRHALELVPDDTVFGYMRRSSTGDELSSAIRQVFLEEQCYLVLEASNTLKRLQDSKLGLTRQELEVLVDIAIGLTDKAIASRRFLSRRGVTNRLNSVYKKLGLEQADKGEWGQTYNLRNRAVRLALQRGVLTSALIEQCEQEWEAFRKGNA